LRLKILKKLRTVSLNSEFTGSYKKVYLLLKVGKNGICTVCCTLSRKMTSFRQFENIIVLYGN